MEGQKLTLEQKATNALCDAAKDYPIRYGQLLYCVESLQPIIQSRIDDSDCEMTFQGIARVVEKKSNGDILKKMQR